MGGVNPKNVWWNDGVKAAVKRKETDLKEVLGARDEDVKERCMEAYKEEKRKVIGAYIKTSSRFMNNLEER